MSPEQYDRLLKFVAFEFDTGTISDLKRVIGGSRIVLSTYKEAELFYMAYRMAEKNTSVELRECDDLMAEEIGEYKKFISAYRN